MFNSFSSALAALKAHSAAVDTVGHNLANVNTTGFKGSAVAFKDIVSESIGGQGESGMGVGRALTVRSFAQGSIQTTSGALDAAIQGNGFFVVKQDGVDTPLLTRDGTFTLDKEGYIVTLTGERVQKLVDNLPVDIQIPSGASGATATSEMSLTGNLDASAEIGDTFSQPIEVVDSLGDTHVVTLKYEKTDANEWSIEALIPDNAIGGADATLVPLTLSPGNTLTFDATGKLTTPAAPDTITIDIPGLTNSAEDMSIELKLHDNNDIGLLTQFAQASSASKTTQNGVPAAAVTGVGIGDGGRVIARYGNGQEKEIATLAMALVLNPTSLAGAGNNMYRFTGETTKTWGTAGKGGLGGVKGGALEASTVDMAREFTNLIVFQRGYQANSRVITTADEMSQEILNLKR